MWWKLASVAVLISALGLAACNTMEGAGEDVESAGETVQKKADENRPNE